MDGRRWYQHGRLGDILQGLVTGLMGFLGGLVKDSIVIIATLSLKRRKAVTHEQVPIPKIDSQNAAWGADGESVLISLRKAGEKWDIYRFRLLDGQLSQLTDHPASDTSPNEWNPRLSVSPQGLTPTRGRANCHQVEAFPISDERVIGN